MSELERTLNAPIMRKEYMELLNVNGANILTVIVASWSIQEAYYLTGIFMLVTVSVFNIYKVLEIIRNRKKDG